MINFFIKQPLQFFRKLELSQKIISFTIIAVVSILIFDNLPAKYKFLYSKQENITVEPTGKKNIESKSNEVWISSIVVDGENINLEKIKIPNNWEYKENSIVFANTNNNALRLNFKYFHTIEIYFIKHQWSGIVNISSTNNEKKEIDLFGKDNEKYFYKIESKIHNSNIFYQIFSLIIVFFLILFLVFRFIKINHNNIKYKKNSFIIFSLIPLIIWIIYLLSFFPGLMSPDSFDQWSQIIKFSFNDWHPVFHTLIIWILTRIWLSPAIIILFQILFLFTTLVITFNVLQTYKINKYLLTLFAIFLAISPVNGMMIITLWKDIPYSISILLLSIVLLNIITSDGKWILSKKNKIITITTLILVSLLRHNGLPVGIISYFSLILITINQKKIILKTGIIFLLLTVIIKIPIYNSLKVVKSPKYLKDLMILQVIAPSVINDNLDNSENEYLNSIYPIDIWKKKYDPCSTNYITFSNYFNREIINKNQLDFYKKSSKIIFKHPKESIIAILNMNSTILKLNNPKYCNFYTTFTKIDDFKSDHPYFDLQNKYNLKTQSLIKISNNFFKNILELSFNKINIIFFWRPFVDLVLILFFGLIFILKTSSKNLIIFLPLLLNIISLFFTIPGQDYRYYYSLHISLILIVLAFIKKYNIKK